MSIIASHFDVFSGGAVTWKREKKMVLQPNS